MFTHQVIKQATIMFTASLFAIGCAGLDSSDLESGEKSFGKSANTVYSCETATIAPSGHQWIYKTPEIMNLMSEIKLSVQRDDESYGSYALQKLDTDTFSDGNLTVHLMQAGPYKSIAVEHRNAELVARAENGWCTAYESDAYASNSGSADSQSNTWGDTQADSTWGDPAWGDSQNNTQNNTQEPSIWAGEEFELDMLYECQNPCVFAVKSALPLSRVVYLVDGYEIAESYDAAGKFAALYNFYQFGMREVTAIGYDHFGQSIAQNSRVIRVAESVDYQDPQYTGPSRSVQLNVPYFYQYDNSSNKGNSCQVTSIAMVLKHYGVNIHPDDLLRALGYDVSYPQNPHGLMHTYNEYAQYHGVPEITLNDQGTIADLKEALDAGKPVITHGWFTESGHVLVVVGYDDDYYYVNDPAGTWNEQWYGEYDYAPSERQGQGKMIAYSKEAFEIAILSHNGRDKGTAWLHIPN